MQVWADIIQADPLRLVTGHGVETALRNRISSALDVSAPTSLIFEVWYELGVLGALALTVAVGFTAMNLARLSRTLGSFGLGCLGFAFGLSVMGLGTRRPGGSRPWWPSPSSSSPSATAEYRTERPPRGKAAGGVSTLLPLQGGGWVGVNGDFEMIRRGTPPNPPPCRGGIMDLSDHPHVARQPERDSG